VKIGIQTENLEASYAKLQAYKEDFSTLVTDIGTEVDNLADSWDGDALDAYQEQFYLIKNTTLSEVEDLLNTIGVQVGEVVDAMESMDTSIAEKLRKGIKS